MVKASISNLPGKVIVLIIICCLVMGNFVVNTALALSGSGTQQDPWRIKSLDDFNDFAADANYWADYTRLETDVNLVGMVYDRAVVATDTSSNNGFQGTKFPGVFDGNSHIIFSLEINDSGAANDYIGLFGYVGIDGQVLNLAVEDVNIKGDDYVGGLIGWSELSTVSNCYLSGSINGSNYVGGLVGYNRGKVTNCYSSGLVSGTGDYIGGLIGWNDFGLVYSCYSSSSVSGPGNYIGGLIGKNYSGTVNKCYSAGMVGGAAVVGGLMGQNYSYSGKVNKCYSTSSVTGYYKVGGLVGTNENSSISNCYSIGYVSGTGEKVGGLIGANYGPVSNCFWDIKTGGQTIGVGYGSSGGVTGKMTAEMQIRSTFTDAAWDFINVWNIGENQTYPYLRKYSPANLNKDHKVDFLDIKILCDQWLEEE